MINSQTIAHVVLGTTLGFLLGIGLQQSVVMDAGTEANSVPVGYAQATCTPPPGYPACPHATVGLGQACGPAECYGTFPNFDGTCMLLAQMRDCSAGVCGMAGVCTDVCTPEAVSTAGDCSSIAIALSPVGGPCGSQLGNCYQTSGIPPGHYCPNVPFFQTCDSNGTCVSGTCVAISSSSSSSWATVCLPAGGFDCVPFTGPGVSFASYYDCISHASPVCTVSSSSSSSSQQYCCDTASNACVPWP